MFTHGRTDGRTDGRTPDRPVYYKLTFEPSAQVSLKKQQRFNGDCLSILKVSITILRALFAF